jgi:hypothetical protein
MNGMFRLGFLRLMGCSALAAFAFACGGDETSGSGSGGNGGGGGEGAGGPEPVCTEGTRWTPGTPIFSEVASAWGLDGVEGTRLSTVDFDGDGWADLIVRRGGDIADEFFAPDPCCGTGNCGMGVDCPLRQTWLLRNTGNGSFEDVTLASGILTNRTETNPELGRPGSVYAFGDVDNDGDLDVYVGKTDVSDPATPETSELLLNVGDGTFQLGPAESGLRIAGDGPGGAVFVDFDRNGALDLWVPQSVSLQSRQDHLYWGDGGGLFFNASGPAGMLTQPWVTIDNLNGGLSHTVAWAGLACDLNADGNPDLLSSSYGRAPNHLWQGVGEPGAITFINRSVASGYAFDERVDWSDNESARCHCQLHPTDPDCAGVPAPEFIACNSDADVFRWNHANDREPFRLGGNSGATMCGDVNNDGAMDLLTSEIVHWDVGQSTDPSELLFNTGEPDIRFERPGNDVTGLVREHTIVSWNDGDITGALFDFDNDGWLDVYIGSTDYPEAEGLLFHQATAGVFERVSIADGFDHNRSHGIAVADFDRDGDLDVIVGHSRARCSGSTDCYPTSQIRMFENIQATGNWLSVSLEGGPGSNRAAIGARVTVASEDGTTQTQEVGGGHGHYGAQHDLNLHFGLGTACRADVTVRWPDATLTTETHELVSGYRYRWTQSTDPVAIVEGEPTEE